MVEQYHSGLYGVKISYHKAPIWCIYTIVTSMVGIYHMKTHPSAYNTPILTYMVAKYHI
jgi:hypothetical protein